MSAPVRPAPPLLICSKSAWRPAIRREHSLAKLAAAEGHAVTFIERPLDIRSLRSRSAARAWWRGMRGATGPAPGSPGVELVAHATFLPGHLNGLGERTGNLLLARQLARAPEDAAVVVNVPWQWPATSAHRGRRVFDCADDWGALMGHRSERVSELYGQIGREADAVIVVNRSLAQEFAPAPTVLVRNGVSDDMLGPLTPAPDAPRLVHTGTLTARFDCRLAARLLDALPEWTLDLYGQCQYPGCGDRPAPELADLLSAYAGRVRWHGVFPREALAATIDAAAVALILNRPERSLGQDSMKLYDYAARGRPIVSTRFSPELEQDGPPNLYIADHAQAMADAILRSRAEPEGWPAQRRAWAQEQRWQARWPAWSAAVFGADA